MTLLPKFIFEKGKNSGVTPANAANLLIGGIAPKAAASPPVAANPAKAANPTPRSEVEFFTRPPANPANPANRCELRKNEPELSAKARNLILNWQDLAVAFNPQTDAGEKLKTATLAFLCSRIAREAVTHAWNELQLFGVMDASSAAVIDRRADLKGVVSFTALAPWPGTSIESFQGLSAAIVTASRARLQYIKRNFDPRRVHPFWFAEAL